MLCFTAVATLLPGLETRADELHDITSELSMLSTQRGLVEKEIETEISRLHQEGRELGLARNVQLKELAETKKLLDVRAAYLRKRRSDVQRALKQQERELARRGRLGQANSGGLDEWVVGKADPTFDVSLDEATSFPESYRRKKIRLGAVLVSGDMEKTEKAGWYVLELRSATGKRVEPALNGLSGAMAFVLPLEFGDEVRKKIRPGRKYVCTLHCRVKIVDDDAGEPCSVGVVHRVD
ncbi:MAG: hypothetical protein O7J95_07265, partial [Planctomycetota bacterium]|nr:hypothetical protein [Planctomycetota bacterium]